MLAATNSARSALSEATNCRGWSLSDTEVVEALGEVLAVRAQAEAVAAALVAEADARCLALSLDASTTGRWLRRRFRLSLREADRFTGLAAALPRHEVVGAAQAAGAVSAEQAGAMARTLDSLPGNVPAAERERAEELLVDRRPRWSRGSWRAAGGPWWRR